MYIFLKYVYIKYFKLLLLHLPKQVECLVYLFNFNISLPTPSHLKVNIYYPHSNINTSFQILSFSFFHFSLSFPSKWRENAGSLQFPACCGACSAAEREPSPTQSFPCSLRHRHRLRYFATAAAAVASAAPSTRRSFFSGPTIPLTTVNCSRNASLSFRETRLRRSRSSSHPPPACPNIWY